MSSVINRVDSMSIQYDVMTMTQWPLSQKPITPML